MELNTQDSIDLGRKVHRTFGSWKKARELATKSAAGVYVVDRAAVTKAVSKQLG